MGVNQEHRVDALLAALAEAGIEVSYQVAEPMIDAVLTARPVHSPVRPADQHAGWIYDTHAETAALLDFLVEFYRQHGDQRQMLGWRIDNRVGSVQRAFCALHGIHPDHVMRAYSALRRGETVQYPERREMVELMPIADATLDSGTAGK
jgi:hypothetical protein